MEASADIADEAETVSLWTVVDTILTDNRIVDKLST